MERLTKILLWLTEIAANNFIRYIILTAIIWIAAYWGWFIVSEPFREPVKWLIKLLF